MPQLKIINHPGECKTKNNENLINGNGTCGGMQACNPVFMFVIKTAVLIYILCIIYIIFYLFYRIVRLAYDALYDYPNDVIRPGVYMMDAFLNILCYIAISILWFLTGIFLTLYGVYIVFRAIGFGWLIAILSPWCECIAVGLFSFFDALIVILFAPMMIDAKIVGTFNTTTAFFDYFFTVVIGMTLNEDYLLNNEFLNAFMQLFKHNNCDLKLCPEKIAEFTKVVTENSPIVLKVNFKDGPEKSTPQQLSQMQVTEINNCISKKTQTCPTDASTVVKLSYIFSNEVARQQCYEEFAPHIKSSDDGSGRNCLDRSGKSASCFSWSEFSTDTVTKQGTKAVSDHEKNEKKESIAKEN